MKQRGKSQNTMMMKATKTGRIQTVAMHFQESWATNSSQRELDRFSELAQLGQAVHHLTQILEEGEEEVQAVLEMEKAMMKWMRPKEVLEQGEQEAI